MKKALKIYAGSLVLIVLGAGLASVSFVPVRILGVVLIVAGTVVIIGYSLLTIP